MKKEMKELKWKGKFFLYLTYYGNLKRNGRENILEKRKSGNSVPKIKKQSKTAMRKEDKK